MNNQKVAKVISHGKPVKCQLCNASLESQPQLKKRVQCYHTHEANYLECVICKSRFTKVSNLTKHLLSHAEVRGYRCDTCKKLFKTVGDLTQHKKVHATISCYCGICGKEFSRTSNMLRHTRIHKGNAKLHKCSICESTFEFKSSLTRHMVENHKEQII